MGLSRIDSLFLQIVRIYAFQHSRPLVQINHALEALQEDYGSRERALLALAEKLNIIPVEIRRVLREGKSKAEAISEFLKDEKLTLTDESSAVQQEIVMANSETIYNPSRSTTYSHNIRSKPSLLWYLVPVFFSILGGIVGYVAVKHRDRDMASNLLTIGVFVLFFNFLIAWFTWI
jgi:hypothetical protein